MDNSSQPLIRFRKKSNQTCRGQRRMDCQQTQTACQAAAGSPLNRPDRMVQTTAILLEQGKQITPAGYESVGHVQSEIKRHENHFCFFRLPITMRTRHQGRRTGSQVHGERLYRGCSGYATHIICRVRGSGGKFEACPGCDYNLQRADAIMLR